MRGAFLGIEIEAGAGARERAGAKVGRALRRSMTNQAAKPQIVPAFGRCGDLRRGERRERLFGLAPNDVFVVSAVDKGVDISGGVSAEQDSAFDVLAEKEIAGLGEQSFLFAFPFDE